MNGLEKRVVMLSSWKASGRFALVALLLAGWMVLTPTAVAAADESWTLRGSGWGHGVGMTQYGAMEMARDGRTAAQILQHYYTGTTYDLAPDTGRVSVNIRHRVVSTTMTTSALSPGGGEVMITVGSATVRGPVGTSLTVRPESGGAGLHVTCASCEPATSLSGSNVTISWDDDKTLISVDGKRYKDGRILATRVASPAAVNVVVQARIHDEYLDYVAEVPWSWPQEALRAQAAAARGYALVSVAGGLRSACDCHLYDSSVSQVFAGYPSEATLPYWSNWTNAVRAAGSPSDGYVVRHNGSIIQALYSSSSGGRTQNNEDVWGGSPLPYLRSVADPWSLRESNPRRAWRTQVSAATVAEAFGLPDVVRLDLSARTQAGAVAQATATSRSGENRTISGADLRSRLGTNSAHIERAAVRHGGADRFGTAAAVARGVPPSSAVLIASGEALVDATVGGSLAGAVQAPILLSSAGTLPKATTDELDRRRATLRTAYVIGGVGVVPSTVERALQDRGLEVIRLGGVDRHDTARAVASEVARHVKVSGVVVAESAAMPDVVSSSGPASALGLPILLTPSSGIHPTTVQALNDLAPGVAFIAGGLISTATESRIRSIVGSAQRLSGDDRYATAAAVATYFAPRIAGYTSAVVTSGEDGNLIDALSASTLGQPMLFVRPASLPPSTRSALQQLPAAERVVVVGGSAAVSDSVLVALRRS